MANVGKVKWFDPNKGYGFIAPDDGSKDVFVHISAVEKGGLMVLTEGQAIEYELATHKGKTSAANLKLVGAEGADDEAPAEEEAAPEAAAE